MLTQIKTYLTPPTFPDDAEKTRTARLLNWLILVQLGTTVLSSTAAFAPIAIPRSAAAVVAAMIIAEITSFVLMRTGYVRAASCLFLSILWAVVTAACFLSGGIRSPSASSLIIVVIVGSFVSGVNAGLVLAVLSVIAALGLVLGETRGLLPPPIVPTTPMSAFATQTSHFILAALLAYAVVRNLRNALEQVHSQERRLAKRNRELELLNSVIATSTSSLNPVDVLDTVCQELAHAFDLPHVAAVLLSDDRRQLKFVAGQFSGDAHNILGSTLPMAPFQDLPAAQHVLDDNQPLIARDVYDLTDFAPVQGIMRQLGIASMIILPLVVQYQAVGAIGMASNETRDFSLQDVELAQNVASAVGQALYNAMLYEEIQNHATVLEDRVAERTANLKTAHERLLALSRHKDEFIANVSHEFRTPIASVKLHNELLHLYPAQREKYQATIKREIGRLEHLVEDVLQLSRFDQGTAPFETVALDMNELVEAFIADRLLQASKRDLTLTFEGQPDIPTIKGDPMQLSQVLSILLTNAINYTPAGGAITIQTGTRSDKVAEWVALSVSDTGPGISAEEQEHLFERFFRGAAGHSSNEPGTGLGLAIANEIIERHHGRIEVFSEGISGQGTRFTILLPDE